MKESSKITKSMEKVLFKFILGKYVWFENRVYEGDW